MRLRLFSIGSVAIEANPFALLPVLLAVLLGRTGEMLLTLLALILHEAAHTAMARAVGRRVESIELLPFGFTARITGKPLAGWDELAVAAAGPLFSLMAGMGCCAAYAAGIAPYSAVQVFAGINTAICFLNLMPALPLDGGRMLESLLGSFLPGRAASLLCGGLGIAVGAAVAVGSVWGISGPQRWLYAAVGLLLLYAAWREIGQTKGENTRRLLARWEGVRSGGSVAVRTVALSGRVTVEEALKNAYGGKMTVFLVLGSDLQVLGSLTETQLLNGAAQSGGGITLGELLRLIDRNPVR